MIKKIALALVSCLIISAGFASDFGPFASDYSKEGQELLKKLEDKRLSALSRNAKINSVLPIDIDYNFETYIGAPDKKWSVSRTSRNFKCVAVIISNNWLLASKGCAFSWDTGYVRENITLPPNAQYHVDNRPLTKYEINGKFWLLRTGQSTARTINASPKAELFISSNTPIKEDYQDCKFYVNRARKYKLSSMERYDASVNLGLVESKEQKIIIDDSLFQVSPQVGDPLFCQTSNGREFLLGFMFNQLEFPLINNQDYAEIQKVMTANPVVENASVQKAR